MLIQSSISSSLRVNLSWQELWKGPDGGIIGSWEQGRRLALEQPHLATAANAGALPLLPFRGGHDQSSPVNPSFIRTGSVLYLAMWQGLRADDLDIDTEALPTLACAVTGRRTRFTTVLAELLAD